MRTHAIILAICLGALLQPSVRASTSDEVTRRSVVPNTQAQAIAGELFPQQCGADGKRCGISYSPEFCPLQFVVLFPVLATDPPKWPAVAWVTLDPRGNVIEVKHERSENCRNGNGIAS